MPNVPARLTLVVVAGLLAACGRDEPAAPAPAAPGEPAVAATPAPASQTTPVQAIPAPTLPKAVAEAAEVEDLPPPQALESLVYAGEFPTDVAVRIGDEELVETEFDDGAGGKRPGWILFPHIPGRRVEVLLTPAGTPERLRASGDGAGAPWTVGGKVRLGTTLAELRRFNGRPLQLADFDAHGRSRVVAWNDGALATVTANVQMCVPGQAVPPAGYPRGATPVSSDDPRLAAAPPVVCGFELVPVPDVPPPDATTAEP